MGRVGALPPLLTDFGEAGDLAWLAAELGRPLAFEARVAVELGVEVRVDTGGRLGATEPALPPEVVRRVLSWAPEAALSGRAVLELAVAVAGAGAEFRGGRLFSPPAPSLLVPAPALVAGFRAEAVTGRVGGLLMVLPEVRWEMALGRLDVDDAGVLVVLGREAGFFVDDSSLPAAFGVGVVVAGGFVAPPVRLSMLKERTPYRQTRCTYSIFATAVCRLTASRPQCLSSSRKTTLAEIRAATRM